MADTYRSSLDIAAPPADVFAFVTDVTNMPKYLPTTHHAEMEGADRVRMKGEANGHPYEGEGWLQKDPEQMTMWWGSDGQNDYSGSLRIEPIDDRSRVSIEITFAAKPDMEEEYEKQMGSRRATMQTGLDAALKSIDNVLTGKGGKVDVPADTAN